MSGVGVELIAWKELTWRVGQLAVASGRHKSLILGRI